MDQSQIQAPDPYGRTFEMDEQTITAIAARLEARGRHPFFTRVIDEYVQALRLTGSEAILDLGCGTGIVARIIARRVAAQVRLTAVDISAQLVEIAERLALDEGLDGRIQFRTGDAHSVGLSVSGFDVVIMHTLVSHVADPVTVLDEASRLLRPGGRLVVFDGDYESFTLASDAPDGGRTTDQILQAAVVSQLRVMRMLPRLFAGQGYAIKWARPYVVADIGRADFWAPSLASFRVLLPRSKAMSEVDANAFVDRMEAASDNNTFFGASNFYTYIAERAG